jgi:hypothetical protein
MPISKNGRATTIPIHSMRFRSNTPSGASQTVATPPRRAWPRKGTSARLPDRRNQTRRGLHQMVTVKPRASTPWPLGTRPSYLLRRSRRVAPCRFRHEPLGMERATPEVDCAECNSAHSAMIAPTTGTSASSKAAKSVSSWTRRHRRSRDRRRLAVRCKIIEHGRNVLSGI